MSKCKFCVDKIPVRMCPHCKECLSHSGCECIPCSKCSKAFPRETMCPKCLTCKTHHTAGTYIGEEFPLRRCEYKALPKTTYLVNGLRRRMGIEVEIGELGEFDVRVPQTKTMTYTVDHDGSVRPSQIELVCHPLAGDKFVKGSSELLKRMLDCQCVMNNTCGYHVHVDAHDFTAGDLKKLPIMFQTLQPQIFKYLIDPARQNIEEVRQYCRPLAYPNAELRRILGMSGKEAKEWFHVDLYGKSLTPGMTERQAKAMIAELKAHKAHKYENQARRRAINFHAWMMRGTVEFRCKEGTLKSGDFLIWPLFCGWFVQTALRLTEAELRTWIATPPDLYDFTQKYMPDNVSRWVGRKMGK